MKNYRAVVIGVSAGGLHALEVLIPRLPAAFPLPMVIAHHRVANQVEPEARPGSAEAALELPNHVFLPQGRNPLDELPRHMHSIGTLDCLPPAMRHTPRGSTGHVPPIASSRTPPNSPHLRDHIIKFIHAKPYDPRAHICQ